MTLYVCFLLTHKTTFFSIEDDQTVQETVSSLWYVTPYHAYCQFKHIFRDTQPFKNKNIPQFLCNLSFNSFSYLAVSQWFTRNTLQAC